MIDNLVNDETIATSEEWEADPFGVAANLISQAAKAGLSFEGAMNDVEADTLNMILRLIK